MRFAEVRCYVFDETTKEKSREALRAAESYVEQSAPIREIRV
jgi:hypothetical protein